MSDEPKSGFTRRDLVRSAVVGAVAAGAAGMAEAAAPGKIGSGAVPVELEINRTRHWLSLRRRVVPPPAGRVRPGALA